MERGQSLVEIVFILGMISLLLSGAVVSAIFAVKVVRYSKNKAIATRVAREQIELLKAEKQSSQFWDNLGDFCLGEGSGCPAGGDPTCPGALPDDFGCAVRCQKCDFGNFQFPLYGISL